MIFHPFRFIFRLLLIVLCLGGLFFLWQVRQLGGVEALRNASHFLPIGQEKKDLAQTLFSLGDYVLANDNKERAFLLLFQNNWELRPGGGFIGSFGVLKIKNSAVESLQIYDSGNFDGRVWPIVPPPYPMAATLHIGSWKLRDSNFSPDFVANAKQAEYFYKLGQGKELFDGVVGITTNVLTSLLDITGPITLEGYPGTYAKEDAIYTLEYQVEVGYRDQGIAKGERKSVLQALAQAIQKKLEPLDMIQKIRLAQVILNNLQSKDIQLYFEDANLERLARSQGWSGEVDSLWSKDYLMMVDANLGSYKSDYFVKRSAQYSVDLSGPLPTAALTIHYTHTAPKRDWLVSNYRTYLRVLAPAGARITRTDGLDQPTLSNEFGKSVFGFLIDVPVTQEKTVTLTYTLPEAIKTAYQLKVQKQPGVTDEPLNVTMIDSKGNRIQKNVTLHSDVIISNN